jgi:hypothetical protein
MMWKRRWKNENLHRRSKVRCWIMQKQKNTFFSVFCLLGSISHDCMFTCKNPIKRYSSLYAKKKLYISVLVSARLNSHSKIKTVKVKKIYEYSLLLISMCAPIWSSEMQQQKHKNLYESRAFFYFFTDFPSNNNNNNNNLLDDENFLFFFTSFYLFSCCFLLYVIYSLSRSAWSYLWKSREHNTTSQVMLYI